MFSMQIIRYAFINNYCSLYISAFCRWWYCYMLISRELLPLFTISTRGNCGFHVGSGLKWSKQTPVFIFNKRHKHLERTQRCHPMTHANPTSAVGEDGDDSPWGQGLPKDAKGKPFQVWSIKKWYNDTQEMKDWFPCVLRHGTTITAVAFWKILKIWSQVIWQIPKLQSSIWIFCGHGNWEEKTMPTSAVNVLQCETNKAGGS